MARLKHDAPEFAVVEGSEDDAPAPVANRRKGKVKGLPDQAINGRLKKYKSAGLTAMSDKVKHWEKLEAFNKGDHWPQNDGDDGTKQKPAVRMTWYECDMLLPKVLKRDLKPSVVSEEDTDFPLPPDHPYKQAVLDNSDALNENDSDNEIAAQMMTAMLDEVWDRVTLDGEESTMPQAIHDAAQTAEWLGECFVVDGYDDTLKTVGLPATYLEVYHPSRVIRDPRAHGPGQARFWCLLMPKTLGWVKNAYPAAAKSLGNAKTSERSSDDDDQASDDKYRDDTDKVKDGVNVNSDQTLVDVECFFLRETKTVTRTVKFPIEEEQIILDEITGEMQLDPESDPEDPQPLFGMVQVGEEERDIEVPKYKGGWRYVVRCRDVILFDGEVQNAKGRLPIHWLPWYRVPKKFEAFGVVDVSRQLNFNMDKHLDYALTNARKTSQNKVLGRKSAIDGQLEAAMSNEIGGVIWVETDHDMREAFVPIPGQPLSEAHVALMDKCQNLAEMLTGAIDMRQAQNLPQNASGRYVENLEEGNHARLAQIRKTIERVVKRIARNIVENLVAYEDEERTIKLTRDRKKPAYIEMNPAVLSFDDEDFEARWDIAIDGNPSLPEQPLERSNYVMDVVTKLLAYPEVIGREILNSVELPNKKQVEQAFETFYEEQAANAAKGGSDPVADAKAAAAADKARTDALYGMARRAAESVSQALEDVAKSIASMAQSLAAVNPALADATIQRAIDLARSIPEEVSAAYAATLDKFGVGANAQAAKEGQADPIAAAASGNPAAMAGAAAAAAPAAPPL